ncbi:MAG: thioester reductase domain-containing protein [Nostoc sp. DedQUE08]|nr:thioester reductase domain-containing protein [Nostoc sp. DedQUE08]MDZ8068512.1 thioester reductase domain-containing protein [Nostoc sp. DedQUE08]
MHENSNELFEYPDEIAIIGISGRFPGAKNIEEFWQNLKNGVESITFFSDKELQSVGVENSDLADPNYVKAEPVLADIDLFDAAFFGFSPKEAEITDPQHRLFLNCAWEALEDAGYNSESYKGSIGIYAGTGMSSYLFFNLYPNHELIKSVGKLQTIIGNDKDYLVTRVSYKLNLKGPSVSVQTACSSSLVSVHLAAQSLLNNECDMALAGGVRISSPPKTGYLYEKGSILSPDGHCRAFDAEAQGTIFGSGVGVVVLKRLADAINDGDSIYAVIKGSAVNNDGSLKIGYTAPSVDGQAKVVAEAYAVAGVKPKSITYIEAHGTGTPLGDPIEISTLTQVFQTSTKVKQFCAIGSVKTNVGHLEAAAGITSLIKTVLMMKHKLIPPSLNFQHPNPRIDFNNSPFYVNTKLKRWEVNQGKRLAGVSSFGIGGTNVHLVLEEAPIIAESSLQIRPKKLLLLSAKTSSALEKATKNLAMYLKQYPEINIADVAYTYQVGRRAFNYRRMLVCDNVSDAVNILEPINTDRVYTSYEELKQQSIIFMFPGQGSQYVNMALELYKFEPTFRKHIDICAELLKTDLGLDLGDLLYPSVSESENARHKLRTTAIAQPALFVIEFALAQLWIEWGVCPNAMIGHSVGEYVAACLADVLSLKDALTLVAARGRLMQQVPTGAMLSIAISEEEIIRVLETSELSLAANNAPNLCVVSGAEHHIAELEQKMKNENITCRRLNASHAFHSNSMDLILETFTCLVSKIKLSSPQIPYISNVTGTWITASEATDPNYWSKHLRQTVRFMEGIQTLMQAQNPILLEVGPGSTLSTLTKLTLGKSTVSNVLYSIRHPHDQQSDITLLLNTLGQLWLRGININWSKFYTHEQRHRISLPTYPFEQQRYWINPPAMNHNHSHQIECEQKIEDTYSSDIKNTSLYSRPNLHNTYVAPLSEIEQKIAEIWQNLLGVNQIGIHDNFFELGGNSLITTQFITQVLNIFDVELPQRSLLESPTIAKLAELVNTLQRKYPENHPLNNNSIDFLKDSLLDQNIKLQGIYFEPVANQLDNILLTGATGFLGAFLLSELLKQTEGHIYCLVRSHNIRESKQKIRRNLEYYGLWQRGFSTRIIPVIGDLSRPFLGLTSKQYQKLASQIDTIYHNAAIVNFTYPYSFLKSSNVLGTQEIIKLAAQFKVKPVHFTSSIAVFESVTTSESSIIHENYDLDKVQGLFRGYAQSKWVAEKLIVSARSRGIPTTIYRPGNLGGHSQNGIGNTNDFIWRMIKSCIQLGIAPDLDTLIDITPVNYASSAIVYLSRQLDSLEKTFHLVNPQPVNWNDIINWMIDFGYAIEKISYTQWQTKLIQNINMTDNNALYPLASLFFGTVNMSETEIFAQIQRPQLGCQTTLQSLTGSSITCPTVNVDLLIAYFSHFIDSGFINPPTVIKEQNYNYLSV